MEEDKSKKKMRTFNKVIATTLLGASLATPAIESQSAYYTADDIEYMKRQDIEEKCRKLLKAKYPNLGREEFEEQLTSCTFSEESPQIPSVSITPKAEEMLEELQTKYDIKLLSLSPEPGGKWRVDYLKDGYEHSLTTLYRGERGIEERLAYLLNTLNKKKELKEKEKIFIKE